MAEAKKLKGRLKAGASYGTLPEFVTRVCVDDKLGLVVESQAWGTEQGAGCPCSTRSSASSASSRPSSGVSQHTGSGSKRSSGTSFKGASKQGTYDMWIPRSRSGSLSSNGSGSSEEVFSRSGSSSSSHCHDVVTEVPEDKYALLKLTVAAVISLAFMVLEYIGGYYSSSLAVLSDAGHLLSDFCGFLVSLLAIWLMRRPPTRTMSFGYYRAEVLGSVASVLIVWLVTGLLVAAAVQRLLYQKYVLDPDLMLLMASIGIVINIVIAGVLHGCGCRGNYHGAHKSARGNINVRVALIHVVGDTLQTIAVLIAAIVVKFWPHYQIADPILTFVFGIIVVATTLPILRELAHVLMEGTPSNVDYLALLNDLEGLPGVRAVHNLHVWSLTLDKNALSTHLVIDPSFEADTVLEEAQRLIRGHYFVSMSTIQVERYAREMDTCHQCQPLLW